MDIPPGALLFIAFGLVDITVGLWAYLGNVEDHGAPWGFRNIARTWHGRGSVCAALPTGVVFTALGLAAIVRQDTLRMVFVYAAGVAFVVALVFLARAPMAIRPAWMRTPAPSLEDATGADAGSKSEPKPTPDTPRV